MGEAAIQVSTTMTSAQFEQNFMSLAESKRDVLEMVRRHYHPEV